MKLARSTFYYRPKDPSAREAADQALKAQIEAIHDDCPSYGWPRLHAELRRRGQPVNAKRLRRVMKKYGLAAIRWRPFTPKTTDSKHRWPRYPNLVKGVAILRPNQVWVADLTYIRLRAEFVYLAAILDAFARLVVGWALSRRLDHALTVAALERALATRQPAPGLIHHSDQGVQYACAAYTDLLKAQGVQISMAAKGHPYENAVMEAFYKTLKYEEVHVNDYGTMMDAEQRLPHFLDDVYNRKRLHSALGYRTPVEFERAWAAKHGASSGGVSQVVGIQNVASKAILERISAPIGGQNGVQAHIALEHEKESIHNQTAATPLLNVG